MIPFYDCCFDWIHFIICVLLCVFFFLHPFLWSVFMCRCPWFFYHSFFYRVFQTAFFLYFKSPINVIVFALSSTMVQFLRVFRELRNAV